MHALDLDAGRTAVRSLDRDNSSLYRVARRAIPYACVVSHCIALELESLAPLGAEENAIGVVIAGMGRECAPLITVPLPVLMDNA
jgi:hypothetical protein